MKNEAIETNALGSTNPQTNESSETLYQDVAALNEFCGITETVHTLSTTLNQGPFTLLTAPIPKGVRLKIKVVRNNLGGTCNHLLRVRGMTSLNTQNENFQQLLRLEGRDVTVGATYITGITDRTINYVSIQSSSEDGNVEKEVVIEVISIEEEFVESSGALLLSLSRKPFDVNESFELITFVKELKSFYIKVEGLQSSARIRCEINNVWHTMFTFPGDGLFRIENDFEGFNSIVFNNGDTAASISFSVYYEAKNVMMEKIDMLSKRISDILCTPVRQRLIGAIYYDGWSGHTIYGSDSVSESQSLFEQSSLPDKQANEKWEAYAYRKTGVCPPKDCSFSMFYPDELPEGYPVLPSRKPFWGWRRDCVADLQCEITLAKQYGIDYFMFCFYPRGYVNGSGVINETELWNDCTNNALKNFLTFANIIDFKFCVMIVNDILYTDVQMESLMSYIASNFFTKSSYLKMNGEPIVGIYSNSVNNDVEGFMPNGCHCKVISNVPNLLHANGRMWYAGKHKNEPFGEHGYKSLLDENYNSISGYMTSSTDEIVCVPVVAGWDDRARHDFANNFDDSTYRSYGKPTKEEFYKALTDAIDLASWAEGQDTTILIYAWNEFGEGGYLPPTYGDTTDVANDYPAGNNEYFDFYKLEAVSDAREYWDAKVNSVIPGE